MNQAFKNEVRIHGMLAKDPAIRYTASGKCVANLAVVTKYEQHSEFHRVVAWEDFAKKVEALHKGDFLKVVGRLQTRNWEDAAKVKHYSTEIVAFQVVIPAEEPEPLTPDATKGGTATARAILRPAREASDGDPAF